MRNGAAITQFAKTFWVPPLPWGEVVAIVWLLPVVGKVLRCCEGRAVHRNLQSCRIRLNGNGNCRSRDGVAEHVE